MNALADTAHKQGMPHSHMHFITRPHYNHPYISSSLVLFSLFSVDWRATATMYVAI